MTILYKDKAGNTLRTEGKRAAVRNSKGEIVNMEDTRRFLSRKPVKEAWNKHFGAESKAKVVLWPIKKKKTRK